MKKERAPARVLRMSIEHKGGPSLLSSEHACVTCVTCVTVCVCVCVIVLSAQSRAHARGAPKTQP